MATLRFQDSPTFAARHAGGVSARAWSWLLGGLGFHKEDKLETSQSAALEVMNAAGEGGAAEEPLCHVAACEDTQEESFEDAFSEWESALFLPTPVRVEAYSRSIRNQYVDASLPVNEQEGGVDALVMELVARGASEGAARRYVIGSMARERHKVLQQDAEERLPKGHENEVKCAMWSPSGEHLATCGRDKSVWVWEALKGNEFECAAVLSGHSQDVKAVRWHPGGELLVSASYDDSIKVWAEDRDEEEWRCVQTLGGAANGHSSTVWSVAFDASGDRMASCSDDLTLKVWDTSSEPTDEKKGTKGWKHLCTLSGYHERTIFSVDWSSLNGLIVTGAADNCIRLFGEDTDAQVSGDDPSPSFKLIVQKENAHGSDVNCVRWHPKDPRLLASAGDDGEIKIWRLTGGDEILHHL